LRYGRWRTMSSRADQNIRASKSIDLDGGIAITISY